MSGQDPQRLGEAADPYAASAARSRARRAADQRRRRRRLLQRAVGVTAAIIAVGLAIFLVARPSRTEATGPGHKARASGRSGRAAGQTVAGGTWLVPTAGTPPTVAAENRSPGTQTWRLRGPSDDIGGLAYGSVSGYVSAQAVRPGQTLRIYASAPGAQAVRIRIFRIGWYGGAGGREMFVSRRLEVRPQPPCAHVHETGLTECDWRPTLALQIPAALPSGVYIAKISTGNGAGDCLFVVESLRPQALLAQLPDLDIRGVQRLGR